ncbi:MAG: DUF1456 family protein [Bacteriovoracaceae bacterium]|nr:DUF1456 family protein [Bacteriovoracaceae bacterium]
MITNDYLRSIRYLLNINEAKMIEIIQLSGKTITPVEMISFLKSEDEEGFVQCDDDTMAHFLDGLVFYKRGKDDSRPRAPFELPVTNNVVLKKLKVAFQLKEEDLHDILEAAGFKFGRSELSAFFRKKDHPNYRECGDQFLRNFFKGLNLKFQ